jgi:hypothetical protein
MVEGDEGTEIGAPAWLKWMLTIISYALILVVGAVASWIFFPHELILVIDPLTGIVRQGHVSRDGTTLQVPGLPPIEIRRSDSMSLPAAPQKEQSQPPLSNGGSTNSGKDGKDQTNQKEQKDQNVPRK